MIGKYSNTLEYLDIRIYGKIWHPLDLVRKVWKASTFGIWEFRLAREPVKEDDLGQWAWHIGISYGSVGRSWIQSVGLRDREEGLRSTKDLWEASQKFWLGPDMFASRGKSTGLSFPFQRLRFHMRT